MMYGFASSTVQSNFDGTYKAFGVGSLEVTDTADVRFWLDTFWSGDDFGGNAISVVSLWSGKDNGNNIRTDDSVAYIDVKTGTDQWERIFVS